MLVKRAPSWRECQVEICTMQHTVSNLFTYIRMHFHPISPWAFENTFRCMSKSKRCHSKRGKMGYISGVLCQKQVSRAGTSNYMQQILWDVISYPLFADADTRIYPHAASQYHARPKAKRGIAMLSVDKFPYPRKQTRGNEFIPCSNNICDILKRFRSFKIPAITLIWPKSPYKHSVTRSYRSGK